MARLWGALTPDVVSQLINFCADDPAWNYEAAAKPTMASLQAEGVAYLWNLLARHRVALLADEVGMGKTFQALGVAALLWKMKPDAKVLVMAPNRDICSHWKRELTAFTRFHYREADGRVKSCGEDGLPAPPVEEQYRLRDLAEAIESSDVHSQPTQLYLTTIHSLSGLVDGDEQGQDKQLAAKKAARDVHQRILGALGDDGFDLVIIDEAHYFRNPHGGSQRAAAAKAFFGEPGSRLGQRTLLLTATPSHTSLADVANILSYFVEMSDVTRSLPADALMQKYALRRFRIMAGKDGGFTKHQYRSELATPCDFAGHPEAEMFFALYQRRLIHKLGVLDENRRVLYGFLEGFESAGVEELYSQAPDDQHQHPDDVVRDFRHANDSQLLGEMGREYREATGLAPDHPKYKRVVSQCVPVSLFAVPENHRLHENKHLVFVRRIPSVRELTKRINEQYDQLLAEEIVLSLGFAEGDPKVEFWKRQQWSREGFNELMQAGPISELDSEEGDISEHEGDEPEAQDAYLGSKIADLFVTKKATKGKAPSPTDCSRFSLSLRRSTSIHAMFMEPAADYLAAGYRWHFEFTRSDKARPDYTKAALAQRLSLHPDHLNDEDSAFSPREVKDYEAEVETLWSLVFPNLDVREQSILRRWAKERPDIAENFGNYLKAGLLFASPVIVELYCWHKSFNRRTTDNTHGVSVQKRYRDFLDHVRPLIGASLLLKYFAAALSTFEQLCDKIIDHKVGDWRKGWRTLTTLSSPAWYASGDSSHRQHLILGFNSPFYPNTLVATSVFQEGVNLHLQCRKVHHYGIAWTPGDNEQRVGRVDRLFGKVNHLLMEGDVSSCTLDINYPYLKGSFDEDQVGSFIERKYAVEEKMDRCTQVTFDKQVRLTRPGWQEFLRQPTKAAVLEAPYPARFGDGDVPRKPYRIAD